MNKRIKKLVLSKETLLNLSERHLQAVNGGITHFVSCGGSCNNNSCEATCFSCWCTNSGCPGTFDC
jgi:hypothetical protein